MNLLSCQFEHKRRPVMLQPSGAMALFMLRLAGLLSLEKALKENASLQINGTQGPLGNFSQYYFHYDELNGEDFQNEYDSIDNRTSPPISSPPKLDRKYNTNEIEMTFEFDDGGNEGTNENSTIDNHDSISNTTESLYQNQTNYTQLSDNLDLSLNTSGADYSSNPKFSKHIDQLNLNFSDVEQKEIIENNTTLTYDNEELDNATTLPPRDHNTGFSKVFPEEYEKEISKNILFPQPFPSLGSPLNNHSQNVSLEDDSYQGFEGWHEIEIISPILLASNETKDNSSIITLNSRSLVIPVSKSDYNDSTNSSEIELTIKGEENVQSVNLNQEITSKSSNPGRGKPLRTRGIGPVRSGRGKKTNSSRNNPYPYGPKIIPNSQLPYNPDLRPKETPRLFGSLIPDQGIFYDYDEEENYKQLKEKDEEKLRLLANTEEPRILFHFDKPGGYSPKLPDSSLPPTRAPTPGDPWDCIPRCPAYKLLDWNPDYDIRQYPGTTWISTVIIAKNRILAELEGYMKVQDYFYGLNDRGQLMNLTIPFVTQVKYGRHPGILEEMKDFVISLYINHVDDPFGYDLPTPISNEVLIDHLESKTVFVSGFEANVWEVTEDFLKEKVSDLMKKLRQNGEAFFDRYYYIASYSRPELYQPVYYELWIYATTFRENAPSGSSFTPRRALPESKITSETIDRLCRGVECPPFEVMRTYKYGIQKRRYYNALFVTSSPGECQFSTISVWKGFMPLHLYKHGINSHMTVIEATRPIALVHIKEDSSSETECPQNMTMAIYLPKRLHSNPPLTGFAAPNVAVSALQDVVVFAYTVGGYILEPNRIRKELADMKYRLAEFGACFKNDEYYIVVYDFIVRFHGRQNELWIVAENCKATQNG